MLPKWYIEPAPFEGDIQPLIDAVKNQGMAVELIDDKSDVLKHRDEPEECSLFYGSLNLMKISKANYWLPGAICTLENFKYSYYVQYLANFLLNNKYVMLPLSEIIRLKDFIFDILAVDGEIFIRPDNGDKPFSAGLATRDQLDESFLGYGFYHESKSLMVLAASPQIINSEWRMIVSDKKVVSSCCYKKDKTLYCDAPNGIIKTSEKEILDAIAFTENVLQSMTWEPDPIFVIDVCSAGNRWRVVEINAFSTSCLYNCKTKLIVEKASEIAMNYFHNG